LNRSAFGSVTDVCLFIVGSKVRILCWTCHHRSLVGCIYCWTWRWCLSCRSWVVWWHYCVNCIHL